MTTQNTNPNGSEALLFKAPSDWWCNWQALKGTNFRHLTIPAADLRDNLVVITGGNSGIGREAALQFAKWGANVILGCREPPSHESHPTAVVEECKSAAVAAGHAESSIEWWQVDMAELKSVETLGKRLLENGKPIDILVNNAGMPETVGDPKITGDGFEILHQVNFISHVLLTMVVLPSLAKSASPRIICTTSCMQYFGKFDLSNANASKTPYPHNKLYFQTWLTELQHRMSRYTDYSHIVIQGVHPGFVKTNIWKAASKDDAKTEPPKSKSLIESVVHFLIDYVAIDSQQGSICITNAATASECGMKDEKSNGTGQALGGGRYFNRIWDEVPMPQTKDEGCRLAVWQFVNDELGLQKKGLLNELGI